MFYATGAMTLLPPDLLINEPKVQQSHWNCYRYTDIASVIITATFEGSFYLENCGRYYPVYFQRT